MSFLMWLLGPQPGYYCMANLAGPISAQKDFPLDSSVFLFLS